MESGKGKDPGGCRGPTLAGPGVGTGGVQKGKAVGAACGPMDVAGGMGMHHQEEPASFSE